MLPQWMCSDGAARMGMCSQADVEFRLGSARFDTPAFWLVGAICGLLILAVLQRWRRNKWWAEVRSDRERLDERVREMTGELRDAFEECALWRRYRNETLTLKERIKRKLVQTEQELMEARESAASVADRADVRQQILRELHRHVSMCNKEYGGLLRKQLLLLQKLELTPRMDPKQINVQVSCRQLIQTDWITKTDPVILLEMRDSPDKDFRFVAQTEWYKNEDAPDFTTPLVLPYDQEVAMDPENSNVVFKFGVWDVDNASIEGHTLVGYVTLTIAELGEWYWSNCKEEGDDIAPTPRTFQLRHPEHPETDAQLVKHSSTLTLKAVVQSVSDADSKEDTGAEEELEFLTDLLDKKGEDEGPSVLNENGPADDEELSGTQALFRSQLRNFRQLNAISAHLQEQNASLLAGDKGPMLAAAAAAAYNNTETTNGESVVDRLNASLSGKTELDRSQEALMSMLNGETDNPLGDVQRLADEKADLEAKLAQWEALVRKSNDKIAALKTENMLLLEQQHTQGLNASTDDQTDELAIDVLNTTISTQRTMLAELESEKKSLQQLTSNLQENIDTLKASMGEKDRENASLRQDLLEQSTASQSDGVRKNIFPASGELNESVEGDEDNTVARLRAQVQTLTRKNKALETKRLLTEKENTDSAVTVDHMQYEQLRHSARTLGELVRRLKQQAALDDLHSVSSVSPSTHFQVLVQPRDLVNRENRAPRRPVIVGFQQHPNQKPQKLPMSKHHAADGRGSGMLFYVPDEAMPATIMFNVYDTSKNTATEADKIGSVRIPAVKLFSMVGQTYVVNVVHSDPTLRTHLIRQNSRLIIYCKKMFVAPADKHAKTPNKQSSSTKKKRPGSVLRPSSAAARENKRTIEAELDDIGEQNAMLAEIIESWTAQHAKQQAARGFTSPAARSSHSRVTPASIASRSMLTRRTPPSVRVEAKRSPSSATTV